MTAGYIGSITARLPVSTLSSGCTSIELDELLVTLQPVAVGSGLAPTPVAAGEARLAGRQAAGGSCMCACRHQSASHMMHWTDIHTPLIPASCVLHLLCTGTVLK